MRGAVSVFMAMRNLPRRRGAAARSSVLERTPLCYEPQGLTFCDVVLRLIEIRRSTRDRTGPAARERTHAGGAPPRRASADVLGARLRALQLVAVAARRRGAPACGRALPAAALAVRGAS